MRTHGEAGLTITGHLRLIRRSLIESWPVSPEERAKAVEFIMSVIENASGESRPKERLAAVKILLLMSNGNARNALNVETQLLHYERFRVVNALETQVSRCLADGGANG